MGNHPENACYDTMVEQFNFNTLRLVIWKKTEFYFQIFSINYIRQIPRKFEFYLSCTVMSYFQLREFSCFP